MGCRVQLEARAVVSSARPCVCPARLVPRTPALVPSERCCTWTATNAPVKLSLLGGIASCSEGNYAYCYRFAWSVVCLSHSCTLLEPFDRFRCRLAGVWGPVTHGVRCGSMTQGRGVLGFEPQQTHAIENCCCHVANWKRSDFAFYQIRLLWCLLPVTTVLYEAVQGLIFQAHQSHDLLV